MKKAIKMIPLYYIINDKTINIEITFVNYFQIFEYLAKIIIFSSLIIICS